MAQDRATPGAGANGADPIQRSNRVPRIGASQHGFKILRHLRPPCRSITPHAQIDNSTHAQGIKRGQVPHGNPAARRSRAAHFVRISLPARVMRRV